MKHALQKTIRSAIRDEEGATIVEFALILPILSVLLSGIISYALYFMAAHSIQSIANEGARASLAGLTAAEREEMVSRAINSGLLSATLVDPDKVAVRTSTQDSFYTVTLDFDGRESAIFARTLVPMPQPHIIRSATVDLPVF